jgi:hypothetical protein
MFAPAWAVWDFYAGMYFWRPYYLYDWMFGFDDLWGPAYWSGYYGFYNHRQADPSSPGVPQDVITRIRKDQLKKSTSPSMPMPKEMKKALETTLAALKRGDPAAMSSLEAMPRHAVTVRKQDFLSPRWQEKIVDPAQLARDAAPQTAKPASPLRSTDVSRDARQTIDRARAVSDLRSGMVRSPKIPPGAPAPALRDIDFSSRGVGGRDVLGASSFRFRDWNPDTRTAIRLGVEITYSTRTNEVACPELGLSSRQVHPADQAMSSLGAFGSSGGASSPSGRASGTGSASSASHSGSRTQSSGSSGGSRQKN